VSLRPFVVLGVIVLAIGGGMVALLAVNSGPSPSPTRPSASLSPASTEQVLPPAPPGTSFGDFVVDPTAVRSPTTSTAQSKLWFADGAWWGALFGPVTQRLGIFRLDPATHVWADTGALIDERPFVDADVLWTGEHLYTVTGGSRPSENHALRVRRFSTDAETGQYVMDPDFPITIHPHGASPAVLTVDSTGAVWVTFVADSRVWLTHTLDNDKTWSAPTAPAGDEAVVDLSDVSAVTAFGPGRIGVLWTNQRSGVWFSSHEDGDPDDAWAPPEPVLTGQRPDAQLSLTTYPIGGAGAGLAAAVSTTLDEGGGRGLDPLTLLATRDAGGTWDTALFGLVRDRHARPIVLVDGDAGTIAVAATSPGNGGAIYYKRAPLDRIQFDTGLGVPLVASATEVSIDNVTSGKGPLTKEAGMLVLAADRTSGRYLHGVVDLGGGPPTADPADPDRPTKPTAPPKGATATLLRDSFEPWPIGRTSSSGWYVRPEDPKGSLSIVADGGDGQALRVPSSATGVRACRDFAEVPAARLIVRARVRISRIGLEDATILSVRGSGGEAASVRVTNLGVLAWFDRATKIRTTAAFRPRTWYRVTATIDQAARTYNVRVTTDGGTRVAGANGLRWRQPGVRTVETVCGETAPAPPAQVIDFADVSVTQVVTP
jgi:hypothetical protein